MNRNMRERVTGDILILILAALPAPITLTLTYFGGQELWLRGILAYLALLLLPGIVTLHSFRTRSGGQSSLVDLIVYSNILGMSILVVISWILVRVEWLTITNIAIVQELYLFALIVLDPRRGSPIIRTDIRKHLLDTGFVGATTIVSAVFLIPRMSLLINRSLVGGDDAIIARVGQAAFQTGSWPNLANVLHPYISPADIAPGAPLIFGALGEATGVNPIFLSSFVGILSLVLSTLALSLLIRRFAVEPVVVYGLPIVWLLGYAGAPFFFNIALTFAFQGGSPDSLLSIPVFLLATICLIDIVRSKPASRSELVLLALLVSDIMLVSQLTFFMIGFLLLAFGVLILRIRGLRFFLTGCVMVGGFIVALLPPYLQFEKAVANSPVGKVSPATLYSIYQPYANNVLSIVSSLGTISTILLIPGILMPLLKIGNSVYPQRGSRMDVTIAALIAAIICYGTLAYSVIGGSLLGIQSVRFVEYLPLVMIPLVAEGLHRILELVQGRKFSLFGPVIILSLIVASAYAGATFNAQSVNVGLAEKNIFDHWQFIAAEWLAQNGAKGVVVADANNGSYNVVFLLNFARHPIVYRDMFEDFQTVYGNPSPFNQPYYYANLVLTNPNSTNVDKAYNLMNFTYYYLQDPYNNKQIEAFSVLPYMSLVYTNPSVRIFQYTGLMRDSSYLIQAISYVSATRGVQAQYGGYGALNASVSYPYFPNVISSNSPTGQSFDGNNTSYVVNVQQSGKYSIYVHRFVYQTSERLVISVNDIVQGIVFYASPGWTFGSTLHVLLPEGQVTLTLTFEGTVGWADPIDYLVVVPDST